MLVDSKKLCTLAMTILVASCGNELSGELSYINTSVKPSAATLGEQIVLDVAQYLELTSRSSDQNNEKD